MKKIGKDEKPAFLLHSMMCLDILLESVVLSGELTAAEKVKFGEIIQGAYYASRQELMKDQAEKSSELQKLEKIEQVCRDFDVTKKQTKLDVFEKLGEYFNVKPKEDEK